MNDGQFVAACAISALAFAGVSGLILSRLGWLRASLAGLGGTVAGVLINSRLGVCAIRRAFPGIHVSTSDLRFTVRGTLTGIALVALSTAVVAALSKQEWAERHRVELAILLAALAMRLIGAGGLFRLGFDLE